MKTTFLLRIILFGIICSQCTSNRNKITENEILWDTWGVPHIYASNENNLYYSFGWAQMHSHGNLLLKLYGQARGRAAEYWGPEFLETDVYVNQMNLPGMAEIVLNKMSDEEMDLFQSFTNGLNAYAYAHIETFPNELSVVLPIKPVDVVSHVYRVVYLEFLLRGALLQSQNWKPGSNAWAVGPARSASGNALLLANPHLAWFDFWLFYEAHLNMDNLNLYGATLVGIPHIAIGFNDYLGWTHTVNTIDNVDLYEITIENDKYLLDGKYIDINKEIKELKIKEDSVNYRIDKLIVKTTQHGIIVKEEGNKAVAVRFAKMENPPDMLRQWYEMGKSTSYEDFENALRFNESPLFNVIYADKEGNIFYYLGGIIPRKPFGDWNTWRGVVSGTDSENIWHDYLTFNEIPKLLNPDNGWLQNANDPPFTSTIPTVLSPEAFPGYLAPNNMSFRAQQSANLLLQDNDITLDEFVEYKHSTKSLLAERILDDLTLLRNQTLDSLTIAAFEVLESWDMCFDEQSKGAVLFIHWIQNFAGNNLNSIFETPWSFDQPNTTPDGIGDNNKAIQALTKAAHSLIETHGTLEVEYGDVYRVRVGEYDLPANGGSNSLGLFRTLNFQQDEDGRFYAYMGDGFVATVEFGEKVKAKILLSYGNATQPGNNHIGDQLQLFAKKQLRDAWLDRKDIEVNLEFKEPIEFN